MRNNLQELIEKVEDVFHSLEDHYSSKSIELLKLQFEDCKKDECCSIDEKIDTLQEILENAQFILNDFWDNVTPFVPREYEAWGDTFVQV